MPYQRLTSMPNWRHIIISKKYKKVHLNILFEFQLDYAGILVSNDSQKACLPPINHDKVSDQAYWSPISHVGF